MRLTLRTLLVYLDDVLEGAERDQLRQQIETSEAAVAWVHRTRDVMGRLRLGAAEPDADEGATDANRVAEYLDRVMPEEEVAEFERVCLESDAGLAEVAACHHVLALVLGEDHAIDPDTRRRLVELSNELETAMQASSVSAGGVAAERLLADAAAADDAPPVVTPAVVQAGADAAPPVAPDYLRDEDEGSALASWGPAIAAAVLLAVTALLVVDPAGLFRQPAEDPAEAAEVSGTNATASSEPAEPQQADQALDASAAIAAEPRDSDATSPLDQPDLLAKAAGQQPAPGVLPTGSDVGIPDAPSGDTPTGQQTEIAPPADDPVTAATEVAEGEAEPAPSAAPAEEAEPVPPEPWLATVGAKQLVLLEESPDRWRRSATGETYLDATRVVTPPAYESSFELGPTLLLQALGDSDTTLTGVEPESEGEPGALPRVEVRYGRLVFSNAEEAESDATFLVGLDGVDYRATLAPGAVLALHVERPFVPGHPMQSVPAPLLVVAHSVVGPVNWSGPRGGASHEGAESWVAVGDRLAGVPPAFREPKWAMEGDTLSVVDRRGAPQLAKRQDLDPPIWQRLMSVADPQANRIGEVRRLAARVALTLGHPEPLVATFEDPEERLEWAENLAALRRAGSRSNSAAKAIAGALAAKYGEQTADELVEMITGYTREEVGGSPSEVSDGLVADAIVPRLGSESLVLRVFANLILEESVAPPARPYSPLDDRNKRRLAVNRLVKQLEANELQPLAD